MDFSNLDRDELTLIINNLNCDDFLNLMNTSKALRDFCIEVKPHVSENIIIWTEIVNKSHTLDKNLPGFSKRISHVKFARKRIEEFSQLLKMLIDHNATRLQRLMVKLPISFWIYYNAFSSSLLNIIEEASVYYNELVEHPFSEFMSLDYEKVVVDFEIIRYHGQSEVMCNFQTEQYLVIQDIDARKFWQKHWGSKYYVDYQDFKDIVEKELGLQHADEMFWAYFNYILNFPNDNAITPYKFDILLSSFGPLDQIYNNIMKVCVLKPGFWGYVDKYNVFNILTNINRDKYLVRMSKKPGWLTVSYNVNKVLFNVILKTTQDVLRFVTTTLRYFEPVGMDIFTEKKYTSI